MNQASFSPKCCPGVTFKFYFSGGEMPTFDDPGYPEEVEFTSVECDDIPLPKPVQDIFIEDYGERVEEEIFEHLETKPFYN